MRSCEIFNQIEIIGQNGSTLEKKRLLKAFMGHELFRKVLSAALNPFITYGIIPEKSWVDDSKGEGDFDNDTWLMLDDLASRRLTGNNAKESVRGELARLNQPSAKLLSYILKKDLRAGFGTSLVNSVEKNFIPTFDVMLAYPFTKYASKVTYPMAVEPKLDGVRVMAVVKQMFDDPDEAVKFYSRSGKEFTSFNHLKVPMLETLKEWQLKFDVIPQTWIFDGEMVSGNFNKTVSEVRKKDAECTDAEFYLFDMVTMFSFNKQDFESEGTYLERRKRLMGFVDCSGEHPVRLIQSGKANNEAEVMRAYQMCRDRGLEGILVKDPRHFYERKRSKAWLKIKAEESVDSVVVGAYFGEPEKQFENTLGGLVIRIDGVEVDVGGGYSVKRDGKSRDEFMEALQRDLAKMKLFFKKEDVRFAMTNTQVEGLSSMYELEVLGRMIEVEYHEVTPDGSLRHPRFVRFRDDKPAEKKAA